MNSCCIVFLAWSCGGGGVECAQCDQGEVGWGGCLSVCVKAVIAVGLIWSIRMREGGAEQLPYLSSQIVRNASRFNHTLQVWLPRTHEMLWKLFQARVEFHHR